MKNFLDSAKKSTTDAIKNASKRAIKKTAEVAGYLIGNKSADKITVASPQNSENIEINKKIPKKRYISPEKRQQIIDELRLL